MFDDNNIHNNTYVGQYKAVYSGGYAPESKIRCVFVHGQLHAEHAVRDNRAVHRESTQSKRWRGIPRFEMIANRPCQLFAEVSYASPSILLVPDRMKKQPLQKV